MLTLKKILKMLKRFFKPGPTWQFRFTTILGEILTIVIGIVLGMAVENIKEDQERQERAVELLVSLHKDLTRDLNEMKNDSAALHQKVEAYEQFYKVSSGQEIQQGYFAENSWALYSTTYLIPNTASYEVLKAHGELDIWKNNELLTQIFAIYQEEIPLLILEANAVNDLLNKDLVPYLLRNMELDSTGNVVNFQKCVRNNYMRLLFMNLRGFSKTAETRYGISMKAYRKLIEGIEAEVGKEKLQQML